MMNQGQNQSLKEVIVMLTRFDLCLLLIENIVEFETPRKILKDRTKLKDFRRFPEDLYLILLLRSKNIFQFGF